MKEDTTLKYLNGKAIVLQNVSYSWYDDIKEEIAKSQILKVDNSITSLDNETILTNKATLPTQKNTIFSTLGGSLQVSNKVREL